MATTTTAEHNEPTELKAVQATDQRIDPDVLEKARKVFEVDDIAPITYPGSVYHFIKDSAVENGLATDEDTLLKSSVDFIREQLEDLAQVTPGGYRGNKDHLYAHTSVLDGRIERSGDRATEFTRQFEETPEDNVAERTRLVEEILIETDNHAFIYHTQSLIFFLDGNKRGLNGLAADMGHNRYLQSKGKASIDGDDPQHKYTDRLVNFAFRNPSGYRNALLRQLDTINGEDFDVFAYKPTPEESEIENVATLEATSLPDIDVDFEILANQELNFEILPGDTNLRELSEQILDESSDIEKERVDLERIKILEDMRQLFGPEHCFFARGTNTGRQYESDSGEKIDEDFIVLVMQNHNDNGDVVSEDALAISPISRRHAAFYARQEASAGISWREVFSFSKEGARLLGARKLKFVGNEDMTPHQAVTEKIFALASCPASEFEDELRYNAMSKSYETKSARVRRSLARRATQSDTV